MIMMTPEKSSRSLGGNKTRRAVNTVTEAKYSKYLDSPLGHLTRKERSVLEPDLRKFRQVFQHDDDAEFKGTDLVEHRIIRGDAKPFRKAPYRVPYALREEMETQVRDMLKMVSLNPAFYPGRLRPSWFLRNHQTAGRSIVSA